MNNHFKQLTLEMHLPKAMQQQDFFVSDSNRLAADFISLWPDWEDNTACLIGEKGSGKTHLANIWRIKTGAYFYNADEHTSLKEILTIKESYLILKNLSKIMGVKENEEALFHLLNRAKLKESTILILDDMPPSKWPVILADLNSRCKALPLYKIQSPDDLLIQVLILKQFKDRQLTIMPEALAYIAKHIHRSYDAISQIVQKIDTLALSKKRGITIPLIKEVLSL